METILLEGTPKLPRIVVDAEIGSIELSGRSNPENTREIYTPFVDWMTSYIESPAVSTTLTINFEHFNTSSSKYILDAIRKMKKLSEGGHESEVIWMYEEDDEEMLDTAEAFEAMVGMSFKIVGYPEY